MAYQTGDTILDDHYNDFATSVKAVWGTGSSDSGYGNSTTVSAVDTSTTVQASQWTTLIARITSSASHQGSSITAITNPSAGAQIEAFSALSTNIATITTNRLNVHARQSAVSVNRDQTATFTGTLTFEDKWVWGSANAARFFFNLGGRLSVSGSLSGHTSDTKADNWASLLTAAGTYQVTAQASGKSGGSGSADTNNTNLGYYDMGTSYTIGFKQFEDTSPYTASFVQWEWKTASSGAEVHAKCTWNDAAADNTGFNKSIYNVQDQVDGTQRMVFAYEKHNTTHIADNGGSITQTSVTLSHA